MLGYYAERLQGVELNGSFYRTPPAETMERWAASTPPEFRFCLKAHRGVTYSGERFDQAGLASDFSRRLAPLGDRCGPVLLQFPPTRQARPPLLQAILEALARPVAVEFRHVSWFQDAVYLVLRRFGAALVVTDQEKWPLAPRIETGPFAYYRLRRDYDGAALANWAGMVRSELPSREAVHVYFKHEPEAPERALKLRRLVNSD
jgi:uncharacterized protein YecE (DUF72 family)